MRRLLLTILIFTSGQVIAEPKRLQNPFEKLPFGIVVGQTTNEEIEDRGTCTQQIELRENYFRCKTYNIGDKFWVFSSQNEKVMEVVFLSINGHSHQFPRAWKSAGVNWSLTKDEFLRLLRVYPAIENLDITTDYYDEGKPSSYVVSFMTSGHEFEVQIWHEKPNDADAFETNSNNEPHSD